VGGDGVLRAEGGDALANDILAAHTGFGADSGGSGLGTGICKIDSCESGSVGGGFVTKGGLGGGPPMQLARTATTHPPRGNNVSLHPSDAWHRDEEGLAVLAESLVGPVFLDLSKSARCGPPFNTAWRG
jgi:hypothetical protein